MTAVRLGLHSCSVELSSECAFSRYHPQIANINIDTFIYFASWKCLL
jgi:hypothetical protein